MNGCRKIMLVTLGGLTSPDSYSLQEYKRGQVSTFDKQWGRDGYGMSFVES